LIELVLETVVFFFQFPDAILQLFFCGHGASSLDKASKPLEQLESFGTSLEQNRPFEGKFLVVSRREGNRINEIYGAGDGNRTNLICQNKTLLPAFQSNWSQMESSRSEFVQVYFVIREFELML
jgi:hypothetical protein